MRPCCVRMWCCELSVERATPNGIGSMSVMLMRISGLLVMHMLAPESAMELIVE